MRTFLSVAVALLMCVSCQKKQCWVCEHHEYTPATGHDTTRMVSQCDKTKKEIRDYEKGFENGDWVDVSLHPVKISVSCK
jgi:hypothetical protein